MTSPVHHLVDALNAHADSLFSPKRGEGCVRPSDVSGLSTPALEELTALAESAQEVLGPVKPSSTFVAKLGRKLREAASAPMIEVHPTHGPSWIVGAAAVGSALSLLGLYHLLRGGRRPLARAS